MGICSHLPEGLTHDRVTSACIYVFTRRRGAHTAHTQVGRPTHEAPTREYTHTQPHTTVHVIPLYRRTLLPFPAGMRRSDSYLVRTWRLVGPPLSRVMATKKCTPLRRYRLLSGFSARATAVWILSRAPFRATRPGSDLAAIPC